MARAAQPTTDAGLPKLIGYREIEEAFGFSRKQLERMQADGRFPRAMHITGVGGNRRAWELQQVLDWYEAQRVRVTSLAVTDAAKLKPDDKLEDAMMRVAAEWAARNSLNPRALKLPLSADQVAAAERAADEAGKQSIAVVTAALARLDVVTGIKAAAGLIPALLPIASVILGEAADDTLPSTEEERRQQALDILVQELQRDVTGTT